MPASLVYRCVISEFSDRNWAGPPNSAAGFDHGCHIQCGHIQCGHNRCGHNQFTCSHTKQTPTALAKTRITAIGQHWANLTGRQAFSLRRLLLDT